MNGALLMPAGPTSRGPALSTGSGDGSLVDQVLQHLRILDAKLDEVRSLLDRRHKDFYTVEEFAQLVGRSAYTTRRWIASRKIHATRVSGTGPRGRLLIARSELLRLVAVGQGGNLPGVTLDRPDEPAG